MWWWAGALALAGCGRVAFDATTDAAATDGRTIDFPAGHDEDNDGYPDPFDVCPHLVDDQADADGDLVGDACDPQPGLALQSWVVFDPLVQGQRILDVSSSFTVHPDSVESPLNGGPYQIIHMGMVLNATLLMGFDVLELGTPSRQITLIVHNGATNPYFYGELFDLGTTTRLQIIEFDGTNYTTAAQTTVGTNIPLGASTLRMHAQATGMQSRTLEGELAGFPAAVMTPTPGYAGAMFTLFGFSDVRANVHWAAIIASAPL